MQEAIKSGGIIDNVSSLLDSVINNVYSQGLINSTVAKTIKQGKNSILNNVEKNIENTFNNQIKSLSYTEKYINNWKCYFENKDFNGMEKEYKKIEKEINNLAPIEKMLNEARTVENLHNLIFTNNDSYIRTSAINKELKRIFKEELNVNSKNNIKNNVNNTLVIELE